MVISLGVSSGCIPTSPIGISLHRTKHGHDKNLTHLWPWIFLGHRLEDAWTPLSYPKNAYSFAGGSNGVGPPVAITVLYMINHESTSINHAMIYQINHG